MNDPRFDRSKSNGHNFNPQIENRCVNSASIDHEFVQFRPNFQTSDDDSGACSPPLWKSSPSKPSEPLLSHHHYRSLSPAARLQAIARGQRELMEMVRNMPESSYELSLKDLVEHHRIEAPAPPPGESPARVGRQESKRSVSRSGSLKVESRGVFLKMVLPFSVPAKRRSGVDRSFSSGRVLPAKGGGEGDWWRKKVSRSSESDSSRMSVNSGAGGSSRSSSAGSSSCRSFGASRKRNDYQTGCWPFFRAKNNKSAE
ncbi:uncharacterized protein LOC125219601 [Salvia hispanica]|uniref:uncharacterized protein LOC125219601 n=1 Tax=Salvia hispanica TaxID=49212 RepID=UPI002009D3D8|nr:uncharacterized protein LOC125219601 [Salvia hispanica]